jgi:hypothetical protein
MGRSNKSVGYEIPCFLIYIRLEDHTISLIRAMPLLHQYTCGQNTVAFRCTVLAGTVNEEKPESA